MTSTPKSEIDHDQGGGVEGIDCETAAWAWLERKFGTESDDPLDRAYDPSEMVDAFHAGHAHRLAAQPERTPDAASEAVFQCIYGPRADPFLNPEAWEFAEKVATAALASTPAPTVNARLVEALRWYGEQARLARLIHSEGDAGRHALQADGGKRARAALADLPDEVK